MNKKQEIDNLHKKVTEQDRRIRELEIARQHAREYHKESGTYQIATIRVVQFDGLSQTRYRATGREMHSGRRLRVQPGDIVSLTKRYGRRPVGVVVAVSQSDRPARWEIDAIGGSVAKQRGGLDELADVARVEEFD